MYTEDHKLYIAHCDEGPLCLEGKMANRHGLIAGATGTGKTVSLQVIAESFSQAGVPCFMADMKGDLSGISQPGKMSPFIEKRMPEFGIENPNFHGCPTRFYDVFGEKGYPMRTTVSEMGPVLLSRIMDLNDVQEGIMNIVFKIADDKHLLLIDMKDLRLMLDYVAKNATDFTTTYGNVNASSIGAIQRNLLQLEGQGADKFFGEPAFNIYDLLQCEKGQGVMSVLAADKLMLNPKLYSTFLLWLLSELYSELPEVGDMDLPKLVFFFDEAHMMFDDAPKSLVDKVEQVVRLIRSKGVGVYFITQSPSDIPDSVLGQMGNKIQHALRAFTPKDQKTVKAAAESFRANPAFNTYDTLMELGTGEALVSFLDLKGIPAVAQRAKVLFPLSQIGAITDEQRKQIMDEAPSNIKNYLSTYDRESAYERLTEFYRDKSSKDMELRTESMAEKEAAEQAKADKAEAAKQREEDRDRAEREKKIAKTKKTVERSVLGTIIGAMATSFARSLATNAARSITKKLR
jgi:DNA helicase HerA-like ATPase